MLFPPACASCESPGSGLCASCAPAPHDALRFTVDRVPAFALGAYDGALRRAIVAMKHGLRDPLDPFVALLAAAPVDGVLVPLPTSRGRAAQRGFDQAVEIARRLAKRRNVSCVELLRKRGRPQAGRSRSERLTSSGRFALRGVLPHPAAVTLLDDVCTTGATLRDALATVRGAGIAVSRIVVLARTPDRAPAA